MDVPREVLRVKTDNLSLDNQVTTQSSKQGALVLLSSAAAADIWILE